MSDLPPPTLSRRRFLAAAGVSAGAVLLGCSLSNLSVYPTPAANPSPAQIGPYGVNRLILGEELDTLGLEQPILTSIENLNLNYFECVDGQVQNVPTLPSYVNAAVYYPVYNRTGVIVRDHRVPTPNPLNLTKGPYPILLYAHGFRPSDNACSVAFPPMVSFASHPI
jgi:hypothetical protein